MNLGNFSISLAVKDLQASKAFYEKFGFRQFFGDGKGWLIMKNGTHVIGLFQGMFEKNIMTFNPGWDSNAQKVAAFTDVPGSSAGPSLRLRAASIRRLRNASYVRSSTITREHAEHFCPA